jgi:hypothetical protein
MTAQEKKPAKKKPLGKTKADLRRRARIVAKEVINGASVTEALVTAGYSKAYALTSSTEIVNNPVVKATFNQLLDKAGLTDEQIAARIRQLSEAKETKFFSEKGIVTDEREVEALSIQADMVKFAAKVKGHVIDRSGPPPGSGGDRYIDLSSYQVLITLNAPPAIGKV